jgi:hypothetical protein
MTMTPLSEPAIIRHLELTDAVSRKTIRVYKLPAVVGRDPGADVSLDDADLPPYQCMIGLDGDRRLTLWNLRPDVPIRVNGQLATKVGIVNGDTLTFGKFAFIVSCDDPTGSDGQATVSRPRRV